MGGNNEGHVDSLHLREVKEKRATHILPAFDSSILISTGHNAAICESVNLKAFVYYKLHCVNWPLLRQKQMYETNRMDRKISVIDHHAKDGGAGVVGPSCRFLS